jgi:tetratricopeptide (TPR) repeat protein
MRAAGRWLHQVFIAGGLAAAVIGAVLTWWLGGAPEPSHVSITNPGGQIGQVVTGPVAGDVIGQQTIHGVPFEDYKALRNELGVTDEALAGFFAIIERERVSRHELEPTLREIARRYKALLSQLETTSSSDPEVQRLKERAREALQGGDFAAAERLLNEAKARDLSAIEQMQADLNARKLSAAEAAGENGALMMTQLRYTEAADYFAEAVDLLPEGSDAVRADYLNQQGEAAWRGGDYRMAVQAHRRALDIRERIHAPDAPELAYGLNELALDAVMGLRLELAGGVAVPRSNGG